MRPYLTQHAGVCVSVSLWFCLRPNRRLQEVSGAHPVVALDHRRLLRSGGQTLDHGLHRVRNLADVAALFLPAGQLDGQDLSGLEGERQREREMELSGPINTNQDAGESSLSLTFSW